MRRATVVGLIGLALTLLSARPASAQWSWIRWIQELSGPGDFILNGPTVTFGCFLKNDVRAPVGPPYMHLFCDKGKDWRNVERFMGVTFALGDGTNPLQYPSTVEKLERVKGQLYVGTGAFRLIDGWIDVGASGGFMRFAGAREDSRDIWVTRFLVEPFVAVRPLAFLDKENVPLDRLARAVELNAAVIIFPHGFRLSDFGAIAGPEWSGDLETIVRLGFRAQFVF